MDGFYDPGKARSGQRVLTLEDLSKQPVNQRRPVIAINAKPLDTVSVDQSDERQQDSPTETRTASVLSSKGTTRTPSKGKSKGRKEDEKLRDEDESKAQQEVATVTEKPWMLPYDAAFHALVTEATKTILPLHAESEQYSALARLVSEVMGGAVEVDRQHDFLWELHLSELRYELQSNIIPIGQIRKGTYYHRALLYKMAGKWWAVGFATNAQWFVKRKGGMKMGTSMMLPTARGDLDISSAMRNADGSCWRMTELAKKTDIPGRFTFTSQRWNNENDMRVVAVQYDDFALIHTIKTKHGVTDVLNKLFSRTPEVSADLLKKFMQFSLDTGILSGNIVIMPKNGECAEA
uniref:Armadillo repeat containing 3 n=1 Tax=Salmo trutta TaxID=8032 RepID=A0A674BC05_SALTR